MDDALALTRRRTSIFDVEEAVVPLPGVPAAGGVPQPSDLLFIPQDSYESMVRRHHRSTVQSQVKQQQKHRKMTHRQKYRDCIDLTHFGDGRLEGQCLSNPSLCRIRGRVFAEHRKFVFVQHWRLQRSYRSRYRRYDGYSDPDLYPCITRVVGHYDATCTRLCCHYNLLYPLPSQPKKHRGSSEGMTPDVVARGVLRSDGGFVPRSLWVRVPQRRETTPCPSHHL